MKFIEILNQIKSVLSSFSGVEWAFGKPMIIGENTIIPVAKTSMGMGGGGGSAPHSEPKRKKTEHDKKEDASTATSSGDATASPQAESLNSEGGGGGGGIKTEPVGIFLIRGDKAKFYPVVGVKELIAAFGIFALLLYRLIRLKRKK